MGIAQSGFSIEHLAEGTRGRQETFGWGSLLRRAEGVRHFCRSGSFTCTHQLSTSMEIWTGSFQTWVTEFRLSKWELCKSYRLPVISLPNSSYRFLYTNDASITQEVVHVIKQCYRNLKPNWNHFFTQSATKLQLLFGSSTHFDTLLPKLVY